MSRSKGLFSFYQHQHDPFSAHPTRSLFHKLYEKEGRKTSKSFNSTGCCYLSGLFILSSRSRRWKWDNNCTPWSILSSQHRKQKIRFLVSSSEFDVGYGGVRRASTFETFWKAEILVFPCYQLIRTCELLGIAWKSFLFSSERWIYCRYRADRHTNYMSHCDVEKTLKLQLISIKNQKT